VSLCVVGLLAACSGDEDDTAPATNATTGGSGTTTTPGTTTGGTTSGGTSGTTGSSTTTTTGGSTTGGTTTGTTATGFCAEQGLTERAFDAAATEGALDGLAPDLTLDTLDGAWTMSETWTGCDTHIFVQYYPSYDYPVSMASASMIKTWLEESPLNARYVFSSVEASSEEEAAAHVTEIQDSIETALRRLDDDLADHWRARIHYATTLPSQAGWLGDIITDGYNTHDHMYTALGVDRLQVARELGYLANPVTGWATWTPDFLNYETRFFNFESDREERLAADGATVLRSFDATPVSDSGWAGVRGYATVKFPVGSVMETFDTMELDLTLDCGHPNPQACPEWDYLVYAYLCEVDDPTTSDDESTSCGTQIGRFITTYARPGRWVVDASPFLSLVADGGERQLAFYTQQPYDVTLDVRLRSAGRGFAPSEIVPLWSGGTLNSDYNDSKEDLSVEIPADIVHAELFAITSGHGYSSDPDNCGEFCDHQHEFTVNGSAPLLQDEGTVDNTYGCADQVEDGVVPGQYGTWVYGRGGWCPGLEVAPWTADVTGDVVIGGDNTLSYRWLLNGAERTGVDSTDGRVEVTSYLVLYR